MISVDWSQVDPSYEYTRGIPFYWKSIELMPSMAQHIKQFLEKLDVSPKSLHLVGYSLGCHISGFVGKAMAGKVGKYILHILRVVHISKKSNIKKNQSFRKKYSYIYF